MGTVFFFVFFLIFSLQSLWGSPPRFFSVWNALCIPLSFSPSVKAFQGTAPRQTADTYKQVGKNANVCASLLTSLSWSLTSTFQLLIQARAVVSDVVMGQGWQTVDTLESEGQLEKFSFAWLADTKAFPHISNCSLNCRGQGIISHNLPKWTNRPLINSGEACFLINTFTFAAIIYIFGSEQQYIFECGVN